MPRGTHCYYQPSEAVTLRAPRCARLPDVIARMVLHRNLSSDLKDRASPPWTVPFGASTTNLLLRVQSGDHVRTWSRRPPILVASRARGLLSPHPARRFSRRI